MSKADGLVWRFDFGAFAFDLVGSRKVDAAFAWYLALVGASFK